MLDDASSGEQIVTFLKDRNVDSRNAGSGLGSSHLATLAKTFLDPARQSTRNTLSNTNMQTNNNPYINSTPNQRPLQTQSSSSSPSMNVDITTALRLKRPMEATAAILTHAGPQPAQQRLKREQRTQFIRHAPFLPQHLPMLSEENPQTSESSKLQKLMDEVQSRHHQDGEEETDDAAGPNEDVSDSDDEQSPNGVRFREYQAEIWSEKFEELCAFRRVHQHCHVPNQYAENVGLAQWVKRQRYQFKLKMEAKHSTLSDARIRLLNTIGFIWNSHDAVWEERLQDLLHFKSTHGHCVVPSNYEPNPQLAVWTKRQRRQFKMYQEGSASSMTPDRIAKLEKVGFVWDCRNNNNKTQENNTPVDASLWPKVSVQEQKQAEGGIAGSLWTSNAANSTLASQDRNDIEGEGEGSDQNSITQPRGSMASSASPGSLYQPVAVSNLRNASSGPSSVQAEPSAQPTFPRMPKCEFFSFSRSYTV
jgi:Helicase associated domain